MPKRDFANPFGGGAPAPVKGGKAAFANPFEAAPAPALRPIDPEVADQLEGGRYAKPGIGWMDRDNARASLDAEMGDKRANAMAWGQDPSSIKPTDQQVEQRARLDSPQGQADAAIRKARSDALYWNDDRKIDFKTAEEAQAYSAEVDRQIRERAYGDGQNTRLDRATGAAAGPFKRAADLGRSEGSGRLIDLPLELRRDRLAQERQTRDDPLAAKIATSAPGVAQYLLPGNQASMAGRMVAGGAAGMETNDPGEAAAGAASGAIFYGLNRFVPPAATRMGNVARQMAVGPPIGATAAALTGQEYGEEQAAGDVFLGGALGFNGPRAKTFGLGRQKIQAERNQTAGIEAEVARLRTAEGAVDPMSKPPEPLSQAEAGQVKAEYLSKGGDPTHVMSPERVAAVERGEPLPPPEVRPDGSIAAGYDPKAREKGLIEPGALPALDAAEAQGVAVVSSGTDAATGEGYAVGRAPSGEVVEVRAGGDGGEVFYRGTNAGDARRIDEPFEAAKGMTFAARSVENAKAYGRDIEVIKPKPGAKILRSEDAAFWKLLGRRRPPNGSIMSHPDGAVGGVNEAVKRAREAGYDAVSFQEDSGIGTVIINEAAFLRGGSLPAPAPDVTAPRLPEKSPVADTPAPAPQPKGGMGRVKPKRGPTPGGNVSLSQAVRRLGGIQVTDHLRGETERLGKKGTGTPFLIRRKGGPPIESVMQSLREFGYDVGESPQEFLAKVEADALGQVKVYASDRVVDADADWRARERALDERHAEAMAAPKSSITEMVRDRRQFLDTLGPTPTRQVAPDPTRPKVPRMADPERGVAGVPGVEDIKRAGRRAGLGVRDLAEKAGEGLRSMIGPRGSSTRGLGRNGEGDALAEMEVDADVRAKRFRAKASAEIEGVLRASQGSAHGIAGKGKRKAEAATRQMEPVADPSGKFWDSRGREMVERDLAAETPEEQAIKDSRQRLSGKFWNIQDEMGLTRNVGGEEVPMGQIPDGMGKRLPYVPNDLGAEIDRVGPSHPLWGSRMDAIKAKTARDYPDTSPETVEERLLERHKQANARGVDAIEGHVAAEFSRDIGIPDFIPDADGKPVSIQEVNAYEYTRRMADRIPVTVGAQAVFGRGEASKISELRKTMVDEGGVPGHRFDDAVRSIFGMGSDGSPLIVSPTARTVSDAVGRLYAGAASLVRGAARTGSVAWQTPDILLGNQAILAGAGRNLKNLGRALLNAASVSTGRGRTAHMDSMVASGAKTPNVPNFSRAEGQGNVALAAKNVGRAVHEATARVFDETQETVAGGAVSDFGLALLEKAGKFNAFNRDRLALRVSAFGDIPLESARRVLDGSGTPAEVADFAARLEDRATSRATGSNVAQSQRSRVANHPLTAVAFKFYRWFENNIGTTARLHSAAAKAWDTGGMAGKAAATAELTRFWAYKAVNGAAASMLAAFVLPGFDDIDTEWKEMKENPGAYFLGAGLLNAAGGALTNILVGQGDLIRNSLPATITRLFVTTPAKAAADAVKGKGDKAVRDLGKAARTALPLLRLDLGGKKDRRGSSSSGSSRGLGRGGSR